MNVKSRINTAKQTILSVIADINTILINHNISQITKLDEAPTAVGQIKDNLPAYVMNTLTEFNDSTITAIRSNGLFYSTFNKLNLPNCTEIGTNGVRQNTNLTEAILPKLTTVSISVFQSCSNLTLADIGLCGSISGAVFQSTALNTLIIHKTDSICTLSNVNAFASTPFRNGTGGTVYVPQALKATYEQESNWSALESVTFAAIESNIATLEALGINVDEFKAVTA